MVDDKNRHITTATQLSFYLSQTPSGETEKVSFASSRANNNNNNNNSNSKFQSLCNLLPRPCIWEPSYLNNYLPDSEATKHIISSRLNWYGSRTTLGCRGRWPYFKCSATSKISVSKLDDNGSQLHKRLNDVTYVPGLSQRLFSITAHASQGNFTALKKNATTLFFRKVSNHNLSPYGSFTTLHQLFFGKKSLLENQKDGHPKSTWGKHM